MYIYSEQRHRVFEPDGQRAMIATAIAARDIWHSSRGSNLSLQIRADALLDASGEACPSLPMWTRLAALHYLCELGVLEEIQLPGDVPAQFRLYRWRGGS